MLHSDSGPKSALFGEDPRADVEAAALVTARQRHVEMLAVAGHSFQRKVAADHVIRFLGKGRLHVGAVRIPSVAPLHP